MMQGGGKPKVKRWARPNPLKSFGTRVWVERIRVGQPQWMWKTMCRRCGEFELIVGLWHIPEERLTKPLCADCTEILETFYGLDQMVNG